MTKADLARVLSDENLGDAGNCVRKMLARLSEEDMRPEAMTTGLFASVIRARLIELAEAQGLVADVRPAQRPAHLSPRPVP